jgi:hypothetical protein
VIIITPSFGCANLENATFDGQTLFEVPSGYEREWDPELKNPPQWYAKVGLKNDIPGYFQDGPPRRFSPIGYIAPSFYKANLKGADFRNIRYFYYVKQGSPPPISSIGDVHVSHVEEIELVQGSLDARSGAFDIQDVQEAIAAAFYKSESRQAKMPDEIRKIIDNTPPEKVDFFNYYGMEDDPDIKCRPSYKS